jgi:deoxyribose-phosphate aldolase
MRPAPEKLIDHTLLQPDATNADVERLCEEASKYAFMAVCVNPVHVERCVAMLAGSAVRVATVAGFPFGANRTQAKTVEATAGVALGAQEIDMVMDIGALRSGEFDQVAHDIRTVRKACAAGIVLKVIIEACYLDDAQKRTACQIAMAEGADFVKTSTGFGPSGANADDVRLMREVVGPEVGVKAAGGIRDAETFWTMVRAGASRIGTRAGVQIINEIRASAK